jgi:hypothetical protein
MFAKGDTTFFFKKKKTTKLAHHKSYLLGQTWQNQLITCFGGKHQTDTFKKVKI